MSTLPPPSGGFTPPTGGMGLPTVQPIDRLRIAYQRRHESDYIFSFWTALGWSILTLGIYFFYVFYQMMRRLRDHNIRRLEVLDAANALAWEQAGQRGLQEELRPNFERAAYHLDSMRRISTEFREPAVWLAIYIAAWWLTYIGGLVVYFIVYCSLDGDLVKHDMAEGGVEAELAAIYTRLGQPVPQPDPARVKGRHNYGARIAVTIVTFGIYGLWWTYNLMNEANRHFETNWAWEDSLAQAAQNLRA